MMKKVLLLLSIVLGISVCQLQAQSQGKYGHVNSGEILQAMPGIDSLQIKLTAFKTELEELYQGMPDFYNPPEDLLYL